MDPTAQRIIESMTKTSEDGDTAIAAIKLWDHQR
jgi:hypothetical protein